PGRDDPATAVVRAAGNVRIGQYLVRVCLRVEAGRALEHDAILHAQIAQRFTGAVSEPHFHAHTVGAGPDARSESNSIGQHAFEIKGAVHAAVPFEAL